MAAIGTPEQAKKSCDLPGLDDSGYDGLGSVTKGENIAKDAFFNAKGVKKLLDICSRTKEDQFWVSVTNLLILVVMGASVVYLLMMGERGRSHELGGKKAAIKHYYDTVFGTVDRN